MSNPGTVQGQHRRRHFDTGHHHPAVRKHGSQWAWNCDCGGSSCRTGPHPLDWHQALVEALRHSATIAA